MKILITYYSRDGHTKKVAQEIRKVLRCHIDEITEQKNRKGIWNWIMAGRDALMKRSAEITHKYDPSDYDLVVIGTPIWSWKMVPAIRTYLTNNRFNNVAFFITCGGQPGGTLKEMQEICMKPLATVVLRDKEVSHKSTAKKIEKFCKTLNTNL